jgi:hypothetical protein
MSVHDRLPASTDAELPDVPSSIDATRAPDDNRKTLIYDTDSEDSAWIQGHTVNPENLKR